MENPESPKTKGEFTITPKQVKDSITQLQDRYDEIKKQLDGAIEIINANASTLLTLSVVVNLFLEKWKVSNAEVATALSKAIEKYSTGKPVQSSGAQPAVSDPRDGNSPVPDPKI